jgi:SAM-dependent methyltransferase
MPSDVSTLPLLVDFSRRAALTEMMDEPCSRDVLRATLRDVTRLNNWFFAHLPLLAWLDTFVPPVAEPLRILDVGCGNGEGLRRIDRWAHTHSLAVELTGLDINPDAIAIAAEANPPANRINWIASDVFAYSPSEPIHLIVSSLFTHHLGDSDLVRFLQWMERHATLGWFIGDLSRAAIPYHFLRIFTKLVQMHPFVQNDAPISVARAFRPDDWRGACAAAGLATGEVSIHAFKPGRLCVSRRKLQ